MTLRQRDKETLMTERQRNTDDRQRLCWFLNVLVNYEVISRTGPKTERLTILRAVTHETELGDYDFCLSRSHYDRQRDKDTEIQEVGHR